MGVPSNTSRYITVSMFKTTLAAIVMWDLLDTSPHGGKNWMMTEHFFVSGDDVPQVVASVRRLLLIACQMNQHAAAVASVADAYTEDQLDEELALVNELQLLIERHVGILTALGSARSNTAHELQCYTHAEHVETGTANLFAALLLIDVSRTIDKGTEAGIGA